MFSLSQYHQTENFNRHWNLFILCLKWMRGDNFSFFFPHAISICFFFAINWKRMLNMLSIYRMPIVSHIQKFNEYLFNTYMFNEWINWYIFDISLLSEMSLTSSEETQKKLPQESLFWNRRKTGKFQKKAGCLFPF